MNELTADQFADFYRAIHGYDPFPWQKRLAYRVCDPGKSWPRAIALPTAAGKTTCIEIALFALACQAKLGKDRRAPRRIIFVVDRRIVVDQAYLHAQKLVTALTDGQSGIVELVANALRELANDERPLDVYALRGGMYRETAWVRSPLQPTVITSTVDQVGSRLLFRGYGVSDSMKPVHAGLIGNDALILLDEAHCAKPFDQTTRYVEQYRLWGDEWKPPFRFVSITATPAIDLAPDEIERDEQEDRDHPVLGPRLTASKPATLVVAKNATGKKWQQDLVAEIATQARSLIDANLGTDKHGVTHLVKAIGVIVNRVATARKLAAELRSDELDVVLLTGRMRPVDRDRLLSRLEPLFSDSKSKLVRPIIVVATQCLEVGADLDFHALVTECASLDSLRQRFGRLNRIAARPSAQGVIVIRADQADDTTDDPVYGSSLAETWKWLKAQAPDDVFDFGVAAVCAAIDGKDVGVLNAPALDAPVLFPAHLDCWVQTHPTPCPDPDPSIFLHGPRSGVADVQVVFRADLGNDDDREKWPDAVSLCPPSSSEAVSVPIHVFRRWLTESDVSDESSDVEGSYADEPDESMRPNTRLALRWQGRGRCQVISGADEVRPGDTLVVRNTAPGVDALGDFPELPPNDCADEAYQRSRDKAVLRLVAIKLDEAEDGFDSILTETIEGLLKENSPAWLKRAVQDLRSTKRRIVRPHPLGGWVVTGKYRLHQFDPSFLEDDESSESPGRRAVALEEHSRGVAAHARLFAAGCGLDQELYFTAGLLHDLGKLDSRFQAMLHGRSPRTVGGTPLAKSGTFGSGDRSVHRYPAGARHELLSAALVASQTDDDVLLHLIATHHGCARPFADPVEENNDAKPIDAEMFGRWTLESAAQMPHLWNPGLVERFWRIVRNFGWWGAAFRETVFRLADHAQSRAEQEEEGTTSNALVLVQASPLLRSAVSKMQSRHLGGIDGSNPLGFLASLGMLRTLTRVWPKHICKMAWQLLDGVWRPVIFSNRSDSMDEILAAIDTELRTMLLHPALAFADDLQVPHDDFRRYSKSAVSGALVDMRTCEFAAAFGCDSLFADDGRIFDTALRTMAGAGHQHFLKSMRAIIQATAIPHLHKALFAIWRHDDPLENLSMRWDPMDDQRYAMRWRNPSGDPARKKSGSMLGANRLAIEGIPLLPALPVDHDINTTGFRGKGRLTYWTYPIWSAPSSLDAVRTLLATTALQDEQPNRALLSSMNIIEVMRCQRLTVGKFRVFTTGRAI